MRSTHKSMRIVDSLGLLVLLGVLSGCSVLLAVSKPDQKDMDVLLVGTPRAEVLKEFGTPAQTGTREGNRVDTFKYKEGEQKNQKVGRAVMYGGLDLLTFGLWEPFGTATEIMNTQPDITIEVIYDEREHVASVGPAGLHWVKAAPVNSDFHRDNAECRQAARTSAPHVGVGLAQPVPPSLGPQAETVYRDCMRARGYELTRRLPGD